MYDFTHTVGVDAGKEESGKLGKENGRSFACGLERRLGKKAEVSQSVLIAASMMVPLQLICCSFNDLNRASFYSCADLDYPV